MSQDKVSQADEPRYLREARKIVDEHWEEPSLKNAIAEALEDIQAAFDDLEGSYTVLYLPAVKKRPKRSWLQKAMRWLKLRCDETWGER